MHWFSMSHSLDESDIKEKERIIKKIVSKRCRRESVPSELTRMTSHCISCDVRKKHSVWNIKRVSVGCPIQKSFQVFVSLSVYQSIKLFCLCLYLLFRSIQKITDEQNKTKQKEKGMQNSKETQKDFFHKAILSWRRRGGKKTNLKIPFERKKKCL